MSRVIKLEALPVLDLEKRDQTNKRRVAAYARVSTSSDEQLASFESQKDYYEHYVRAHPNWEFVGLYADEGISGVSCKNRPAFNTMIQDALNGSLDLIITKSISRFARNTVDTLTTIRMLEECGVEVYFEREQIFTFDSEGELMLTILSSIAQEESRSISENVTWGIRKRMADGRYSMPYKRFLGYKKGANKKPEIVEEEARIVRYIYRLCLEGRTTSNIASTLNRESIPTPGGKQRWQARGVKSILTNEKYYGAALLQKTYTENFMTKKIIKNRGQLAQYYVEENHEAIISKEVFIEVQNRLNHSTITNASHNAFANLLICGDCGGKYGRKIVSSYQQNKRHRRVAWICNHRYKQADKCQTPHMYEEVIRYAFNQAAQSLLKNKPELMELCLRLLLPSIRAVKGLSRAERKQMINDYVWDFVDCSPRSILFNESAWRIIVEHAKITRERQMILHFIDGSEYTYLIPNYSPIRNKDALK